jgi:hypothetical protein
MNEQSRKLVTTADNTIRQEDRFELDETEEQQFN